MDLQSQRSQDRQTCLLVGKGPSAYRVGEYVAFGDIATINDAALLVPHIRWSFWVDMISDLSCYAEAAKRGGTFVLPDKMHQYSFLSSVLKRKVLVHTHDLPIFPPERTVLYPYNLIGFDRSILIDSMEQRRVPLTSTSVAALYILAVPFRYRHIRCIGFDGGGEYVKNPGIMKSRNPFVNYTLFREAMEVVAEYAHTRYGTIVEFANKDGSFS